MAVDSHPDSPLTRAAARYLYKMMAIKDEYEVARLYSDGTFAAALSAQFDGDYTISYHLAPPLFSRPDPVTGRPKKARYGGWVKPVMSVLAALKGVRGTAFDLFSYSAERRAERAALARYQTALDVIVARLTPEAYEAATELASVPEHIRGFGPVRVAHLAEAEKRYAEAQTAFDHAVRANKRSA